MSDSSGGGADDLCDTHGRSLHALPPEAGADGSNRVDGGSHPGDTGVKITSDPPGAPGDAKGEVGEAGSGRGTWERARSNWRSRTLVQTLALEWAASLKESTNADPLATPRVVLSAPAAWSLWAVLGVISPAVLWWLVLPRAEQQPLLEALLLPCGFVAVCVMVAGATFTWPRASDARPGSGLRSASGVRHSHALVAKGVLVLLVIAHGLVLAFDALPELGDGDAHAPNLVAPCRRLQIDNIAGYCSVDFVGTMAPYKFGNSSSQDPTREELLELDASLRAQTSGVQSLIEKVGLGFSEERRDACASFLIDISCLASFGRCDGGCIPLPMCDSACAAAGEACDGIVHLFRDMLEVAPELAETLVTDAEKVMGEGNGVFWIDLLVDLVECWSGDEGHQFAPPPLCHGAEYSPSADEHGQCSVEEYDSALAKWQAAQDESAKFEAAVEPWRSRRSVYLIVMSMLVTAVVGTSVARDGTPTSARKGCCGSRSRQVSDQSATPAAAAAVAKDGEQQVAHRNAEGAAVLPPPTFSRVVRLPHLAVLVVMLGNFIVVGLTGVQLEADGHVASAVVTYTCAVLVLFVGVVPVLGKWHSLYREGVVYYLFAHQRRHRAVANPTGSGWARGVDWCWSRAAGLHSWYRHSLGLHGRHYKTRAAILEAVEVFVQLNGVLTALDTFSNSTFLILLITITVNAATGSALRLWPPKKYAPEIMTMVELGFDIFYVLFLRLVAATESTGADAAQLAALLAPVVLAALQLRFVHRFLTFQEAAQDCVAAKIAPSRLMSVDSFVALVEPRRRRNDAEGSNSDAGVMGSKRSLSLSDLLQSKGVCRRPTVWDVPDLVMACLVPVLVVMSAVAVARVARVDEQCAGQVGRLWEGVSEKDKGFFPDGFFGEATCNFDRIRTLDLSSMDLTEIDDRIARFSSLEVLDATHSADLTHLSAEVAHLQLLRELLLTGSPVARMQSWANAGLAFVPMAIANQPEMEVMDLSGNRDLSELPTDLSSWPALQSLNVSGCGLSSFPAQVTTAPNLRSLDVSRNRIASFPSGSDDALRALSSLWMGSNQLTELPPVLATTPFEELVLAPNPVSRVDWGFSITAGLPPALLDLGIRELLLPGNAMVELAPEIARLGGTLERLEVYSNLFEGNGESLPDTLADLEVLHTLDLGSNKLGRDGEGEGALPEVVFAPPQLRRVWLRCNDLRALPASLWSARNIEDLMLDSNLLSELPAIPEGVAPPHLKHVDLRATEFTEVPQQLLSPPINGTLEVLQMSPVVDGADPELENKMAAIEAATRMECAGDDETGSLLCATPSHEIWDEPAPWTPTPCVLLLEARAGDESGAGAA